MCIKGREFSLSAPLSLSFQGAFGMEGGVRKENGVAKNLVEQRHTAPPLCTPLELGNANHLQAMHFSFFFI